MSTTSCNIIGIDPGPTHSAWCILADSLGFGYEINTDICTWLQSCIISTPIAIEDVRPYGVLGKATIDTIKAIGVFEHYAGDRAILLTAAQVGSILIGDSRAKTPQLRAYLHDQFGGSRQAAVGTKKQPGPLYGMIGDGDHKLHALCVALAARKQLEDRP